MKQKKKQTKIKCPKMTEYQIQNSFFNSGRENGRRELIEILVKNDALDKNWLGFQLHCRLEDLHSMTYKSNNKSVEK